MISYENVKREKINPWYLRQSVGNPFELFLEELMQRNRDIQLEIPEEVTPQDYYNFYATHYALGSIRLITFSLFFWIGKYYCPPEIGIPAMGQCVIMTRLNMMNLASPRIFYIFGYLFPIAEGVYIGASLIKLSMPSEPIMWLSMIVTSVVLKCIAGKRYGEDFNLCLSALFGVPLLSHIFIGYLFGWLSYTYSFLSILYCLVSTLTFFIEDPQEAIPHSLVPIITIFLQFSSYWIFGIRNEP